jgi:hypothetical protein
MPDTDTISDGYHTFGELYAHRSALLVLVMKAHPEMSWYATLHADDSPMPDGYFIAGMDPPTGQITYHLRMDPWIDYLRVTRVRELLRAPAWDGHTSTDALSRLMRWIDQTPDVR